MSENRQSIDSLLDLVKSSPDKIDFSSVISIVEAHYNFIPAAFENGELKNSAGTNEGSCKVFAFAKLNALTEQHTLALFGKYYRDDVLQNPKGSDHQNIRNFMITGWAGVKFDYFPLALK